ncbi:MAG: hypothetical protein GXP10_11285 [Gammaproteobacteria bacterium]|nr:hypothetical protein [Gammaproteobacteria bacterium]
MRINARLDDSYEEKFLSVQQDEGKNRTIILKEALDQYFLKKLEQKAMTAREKNQKILETVGGIASGSENLSENYKRRLYQELKEKHDID